MTDDLDEILRQERAQVAAHMAKIAELEEMQLKALAQKYGYTLTKAGTESTRATPGVESACAASHSFTSLIDCYRTDTRSSYPSLRRATRRNYDPRINRVQETYGNERLADWNEQKIQAFYDHWSDGGKKAWGKDMLNILRVLIHFGAYELKDQECLRLMAILRGMKFKTPKPRETRPLTEAEARAIIKKAHEMGRGSIALAQAFQTDCNLFQRDVIGEWVPMNEGTSDIHDGDEKWIRGLRWNEIGDDLILRRPTFEFDLNGAPLVMEELRLLGNRRPLSGPIVNAEGTGKPYKVSTFRIVWRQVATAAGVPKDVRNRDGVSRESSDQHEGRSARARK